mmetsp:Transcript_7936/g.14437  ORF Transcript_7936/g.14437 Transcript_7936/m.14437 type:complete len:93 (+) Transcript_7936:370-648(+)
MQMVVSWISSTVAFTLVFAIAVSIVGIQKYWETIMLKLFNGIEQLAATEPCRKHETSCDVADVQHHGGRNFLFSNLIQINFTSVTNHNGGSI